MIEKICKIIIYYIISILNFPIENHFEFYEALFNYSRSKSLCLIFKNHN